MGGRTGDGSWVESVESGGGVLVAEEETGTATGGVGTGGVGVGTEAETKSGGGDGDREGSVSCMRTLSAVKGDVTADAL